MSYAPPSRYKDGRAYDGNKQFLNQGIKRSCSKCGEHKPSGGFKLRKPWGMCCADCQPIAVNSKCVLTE